MHGTCNTLVTNTLLCRDTDWCLEYGSSELFQTYNGLIQHLSLIAPCTKRSWFATSDKPAKVSGSANCTATPRRMTAPSTASFVSFVTCSFHIAGGSAWCDPKLVRAHSCGANAIITQVVCADHNEPHTKPSRRHCCDTHQRCFLSPIIAIMPDTRNDAATALLPAGSSQAKQGDSDDEMNGHSGGHLRGALAYNSMLGRWFYKQVLSTNPCSPPSSFSCVSLAIVCCSSFTGQVLCALSEGHHVGGSALGSLGLPRLALCQCGHQPAENLGASQQPHQLAAGVCVCVCVAFVLLW